MNKIINTPFSGELVSSYYFLLFAFSILLLLCSWHQSTPSPSQLVTLQWNPVTDGRKLDNESNLFNRIQTKQLQLTCNSFSVCFCCSIFLFSVSTFAVMVVTDAFSVKLSFTAFSLSFSRAAYRKKSFRNKSTSRAQKSTPFTEKGPPPTTIQLNKFVASCSTMAKYVNVWKVRLPTSFPLLKRAKCIDICKKRALYCNVLQSII